MPYLMEGVECHVYFCMPVNRICVFLCSILLAIWTSKFSFGETERGRGGTAEDAG